MFRHTLHAALMACFLLAGCASYPMGPLRQDILPPSEMEGWRQAPEWWTAYNDPDLDRLVHEALTRNVDLALRAVAVNRALYQANLVSANLLPVFSGDAKAGSTKALKTGTTSENYASSFSLSYEIDLWQRLANAASAASWVHEATNHDREAARLALVNSVVDAYFELRYLAEAMDVTRQSMERYTRLLEIVQTKYVMGKSPAVEPLQAEQYLLQARNNLLALEARRNTAEQLLRDLVDARPGMAFTLATTPLLQTVTVPVNLEVPIAALAARPDIKAAEARLQAAFKDVQAMKNSWYPGVSIAATLSTSSTSAGNAFNIPLLGNLVQVSFPFLDWNRVRLNIRLSEADFETTRLTFIQTVTTALNEVAAARYAFENAGTTLANTLAKHEKDLRISTYYQTRYELGAAEIKDYLDALNTAASSLLSALDAKYQTIRYENQVYKAMGTRWM